MSYTAIAIKTLAFLSLAALLLMTSFTPKNREFNLGEYDSEICGKDVLPAVPHHCPDRPIVTVRPMGRLGNQIWEYASVYAMSRRTGHFGVVPSCLAKRLASIFDNLVLPTLSDVGPCFIDKEPRYFDKHSDPANFTGHVLLGNYVQLTTYVIPIMDEVLSMFTFKSHLIDNSQKILAEASAARNVSTFVGVHVRRGDFKKYLKTNFNAKLVDSEFFRRHMKHFREKYDSVLFVIVSDDPDWCKNNLSGDDVVVVSGNSPEQDLALMAACNHTLMDYGTFGMWGGTMAGGETLLFNFNNGLEFEVAGLMPNWTLVT